RGTANPRSVGDQFGFSLIELLVVVGIFVLLMTIAIPSFSNFGRAQGVTEASYQVAAAIEQARSEAIARSGYVWLAIEDEVEAGTRQLRLGIALVKDSNPTNLSSENLQPLIKPMTIQRVGLANSQTPEIAGGEELSSHTGGATFQVGKARFQKGCSLLFAPTGEVSLTAPSSRDDFRFDPLIAIGIQAARGANNLDSKNYADIGIDGSTGICQIYRPMSQ
ncbi:MAG: prepilin-type N-terminal cleavage/methylation domain-containing protein, partial [Chthoniobacterales bacterium]|nr:prepilin-type N-terminal cleavage/methylation domain-containing protein [Chthoniobacterales bacterium]